MEGSGCYISCDDSNGRWRGCCPGCCTSSKGGRTSNPEEVTVELRSPPLGTTGCQLRNQSSEHYDTTRREINNSVRRHEGSSHRVQSSNGRGSKARNATSSFLQY